MAESTFPGTTSPFSAAAGSTDRGMHTLNEDEEMGHGNTSPRQSGIYQKPAAADAKSRAPPLSFNSAFGTPGFTPGQALPEMSRANLPTDYNFGRRTSVSAESMNPANSSSDNWTPPYSPKTDDQEARLRAAVSPNFLFSNLDEAQTKQVLGALKEKPIPAAGIKVIYQGDVGDYFYIVEEGHFDIYINKSGKYESTESGMGTKVTSIGPGGSFGELALMYNAPRAATVVSSEPATLWALDRMTFRRIIMDSAFQRRQMYETFLSEVPLLETLTPYERSKIADALHTEKYPPGSTIIKQGDPGENFYILESGEVEILQDGKPGPINTLSKGAYFGELALLHNEPRLASVVSKTDVKVVTLGKEGFQRLLGPVEEIMRRNDPTRVADS